MAARTLSQKVWDNHVVTTEADGSVLLYIDLHLVHEVTSPQAFEALRMSGRSVRRPDLTLSTVDHGVPTTDRELGITDPKTHMADGVFFAEIEPKVREKYITLFEEIKAGF